MIGQRRPKDGDDLVLIDQLLEGVDGLGLLAGSVFTDDFECCITEIILRVDLFGGEHDAVLNGFTVEGDGAAQRVGTANFDGIAQPLF